MLLGTLNDEVSRRLAGAHEFRPDADVTWRQRPGRDSRPVRPNRFVKNLGPTGIGPVVDLADPFHVGAEPRLSGQIQSHVHAQSRTLRQGIDEVFERTFLLQDEVSPLGVASPRHMPGIQAGEQSGDLSRAQSSGIDYGLRMNTQILAVASDREPDAVVVNGAADELRQDGNMTSRGLQVAM